MERETKQKKILGRPNNRKHKTKVYRFIVHVTVREGRGMRGRGVDKREIKLMGVGQKMVRGGKVRI